MGPRLQLLFLWKGFVGKMGVWAKMGVCLVRRSEDHTICRASSEEEGQRDQCRSCGHLGRALRQVQGT